MKTVRLLALVQGQRQRIADALSKINQLNDEQRKELLDRMVELTMLRPHLLEDRVRELEKELAHDRLKRRYNRSA
jgi:hypothetical protein